MSLQNLKLAARNGKQIRSSRCGAVTVEFAIVAPIFFLLVLAAFEFGWLQVMRHTADNAAYEAARVAMVPGATVADAVNKANQILGVVHAHGATVTVNPNPITNSTTQLSVAVDIPMARNGLVLPRFTRATNLHSVSTLQTERSDQN